MIKRIARSLGQTLLIALFCIGAFWIVYGLTCAVEILAGVK